MIGYCRPSSVREYRNARRFEKNAQIGLLDPPEHLLVERLLERLGRPHHLLGIGVLRLQVAGHLGSPLLAQPEIVVGEGVAVDAGDVRRLRGHGRRSRRPGLGDDGGSGNGRGDQAGSRSVHLVVVQDSFYDVIRRLTLSEWTVTEEEAGARLDKYLAAGTRLGSRSRAASALERGKVYLNGQEASLADAARVMLAGDSVRLWTDRPGSARARPRTGGVDDLDIV